MKKFIRGAWEMLQTVVIAVSAVLLVRAYVVQPFLVSGESMAPTFKTGDYLLVDEISYNFRDPQRGEIVVLKYPKDRNVYFIKRVIGLPGETVIIENGKVGIFKDGKEIILNESYTASGMAVDQKFKETLGSDQFFVMGDNRNYSFDSRNWGSLSKKDIVGVVRLRLWPLKSAMAFSVPDYSQNINFNGNLK
jgi:signal peptidase I